MNEFKMRMKVSDFDPGLPASISGAISVRCASRTSFSFSSADGSAHRSSAGPDVAIDDDFSLAGGTVRGRGDLPGGAAGDVLLGSLVAGDKKVRHRFSVLFLLVRRAHYASFLAASQS